MECDTAKPKLVIRSGTITDYEAIARLCDMRFGTGYVDRQMVENWTHCPELFVVAECAGHFAGFSVMVPHTPQKLAQLLDMPLADVLQVTGDKPPLHYKTGVVAAAYEHQGVMSALAAQGLKQAVRMGFGALFTAAWEYGGVVPAEGVLLRYGFERLYKRSMLWYHQECYVCVICKGRCQCDGVIFHKKL